MSTDNTEALIIATNRVVVALRDLADTKEDVSNVAVDEFEWLHTDGAEDFEGAMDGYHAAMFTATKALDAFTSACADTDKTRQAICHRRALDALTPAALRSVATQYQI